MAELINNAGTWEFRHAGVVVPLRLSADGSPILTPSLIKTFDHYSLPLNHTWSLRDLANAIDAHHTKTA